MPNSRKLLFVQQVVSHLPKLCHYKVIDITQFNKVDKKIAQKLSMQITSSLSIFHKKIIQVADSFEFNSSIHRQIEICILKLVKANVLS